MKEENVKKVSKKSNTKTESKKKPAIKKNATVKREISKKTPVAKKQPVKKNEAVKKEKKVVNSKKVKNIDIAVLDEKIKKDLKKFDNENTKLENTTIMTEKQSKKLQFSLFEVILLNMIAILACLLVCIALGYRYNKEKDTDHKNDNIIAEQEKEHNNDDALQSFIEQYNYILNNYYGDIDSNILIRNALTGMLSSLDSYSEVIDEQSNTFTITLEGEYEGLGIVIYNEEDQIVIQEVYDDTPASKAGLKAGDIITKMDSESLKNVATADFVQRIKDRKGATLTVLRGTKEIKVDLKVEKIILKSVKSEMLNNKVGYIDVDIFAANTYSQFKTALEALEKKNMKSLIIDLRDNTGGHLSAVEDMLDLFMSDKHIIYQTEDKNGIEKVYSDGTKDKKYKIVILQNTNSASASEIMAAALKEELNAYIIGNKSFGKGTVQQLNTVDGIGQYKFTTKRWLTPKGNWINGTGINPDKEVNLTEEYYKNPVRKNDTQLNSALDYLK